MVNLQNIENLNNACLKETRRLLKEMGIYTQQYKTQQKINSKL